MKLWNAMRWRPIHITSTTTQSWKRYISASAPSLRDAVKIESSDTGKPADAKAKAAKTEVKHEIATDVPKEDHRAKKSSRRWTDAEIRILMEAYDAGLRDRAIQEKLPGRTLLSVQQAVNLYRLQGPSAFKYEPAQPWTPDGAYGHPSERSLGCTLTLALRFGQKRRHCDDYTRLALEKRTICNTSQTVH